MHAMKTQNLYCTKLSSTTIYRSNKYPLKQCNGEDHPIYIKQSHSHVRARSLNDTWF